MNRFENWGIWEGIFLSTKPSELLGQMAATNALPGLLSRLIGCKQDEEHHPEGDVWQHTMHVVDAGAAIARRENMPDKDIIILVAACLIHDIGKPDTQTEKLRFPGHAKRGGELCGELLESMDSPHWLFHPVARLTENHMAHASVGTNPSCRMANRLKVRLQGVPLEMLGYLVEADHSGRPPIPPHLPENFRAILAAAKAQPEKIEPLVNGRDLIQAGLASPGPELGEVLRRILAAQIDCLFFDKKTGIEMWENGKIP